MKLSTILHTDMTVLYQGTDQAIEDLRIYFEAKSVGLEGKESEELSKEDKEKVDLVINKMLRNGDTIKQKLDANISEVSKLLAQLGTLKKLKFDKDVFGAYECRCVPYKYFSARPAAYKKLFDVYLNAKSLAAEAVHTGDKIGTGPIFQELTRLFHKGGIELELEKFMLDSGYVDLYSISNDSKVTKTKLSSAGYTPENTLSLLLDFNLNNNAPGFLTSLKTAVSNMFLSYSTMSQLVFGAKQDTTNRFKGVYSRLKKLQKLEKLFTQVGSFLYHMDLLLCRQLITALRVSYISGTESLNLYNINYTDIVAQDVPIESTTDIVVEPDIDDTSVDELETAEEKFLKYKQLYTETAEYEYSSLGSKAAAHKSMVQEVLSSSRIFNTAVQKRISEIQSTGSKLIPVQKGLVVELLRKSKNVPTTVSKEVFQNTVIPNLVSYSELNDRFAVYQKIRDMLFKRASIIGSPVKTENVLSSELSEIFKHTFNFGLVEDEQSIYSSELVNMKYKTICTNNLFEAGYHPIDLHRLVKLAEELTDDLEEDESEESTTQEEINVSVHVVNSKDEPNYIDNINTRRHRLLSVVQLKNNLLIRGLAEDTATLLRIMKSLQK